MSINANPDALRLMSYNVWGGCPAGTTISNRDECMAAVTLRYLPDALGIQEYSGKLRAEMENFGSLISAEYVEIPVIPTNERKNNYTPIYYRSSRLELIDFGWHYYAGLNDGGSKTAEWGFFERRESGERFIFINTHFYWTGDEKGRAARISNTGELISLLIALREKYPVPVVVGGDLNCNTSSLPFDIMRHFGLAESRYAAAETSPWRSHHAYPTYNPDTCTFGCGVHPTEEHERSIDHILSVGGVRAVRFVTVVDSEALDSSDHCPIFADFVFCE